MLELGTEIGRVAHLDGLLEYAFECIARITLIGGSVGVENIAEHPCDRLFRRPPGKHLEGGQVGLGDHVALMDTGESLDGGSVEAHALVDALIELRRGDLEALQPAEHVGEPELDKAYVILLHRFQNITLGLAVKHASILH